MRPLYCVVPTFARPALFRRTLASIAACRKPDNFKGVIVIENGPKSGIEKILGQDSGGLETYYFYLKKANKSMALNHIIDKFGDCLFYFIDDDIRLSPEAICAMAEAAEKIEGRFFLGGPLYVEYETVPPQWLLEYLPNSARGWQLVTLEVTAYEQSNFFGCNWLASSSDLLKVGRFHEGVGPGTVSNGQESVAQLRLQRDSVAGFYVPNALVWHYVAADRCSPRWALKRAYRLGFYHGLVRKENQKLHNYVKKLLMSIFKFIKRVPTFFTADAKPRIFKSIHPIITYAGVCSGFLSKKSVDG